MHRHKNRIWWKWFNTSFSLECVPFTTHCGFGVNLNHDDGCGGVLLNLHIWKVFGFYFGFRNAWLDRLLPSKPYNRPNPKTGEMELTTLPVEKNIELRIFSGTVWVSLWETDGVWDSTQPWWWAFNFGLSDLADIILGRKKYWQAERDREPVQIQMPERTYSGSYVVKDYYSKRSRWFTKKHTSCEIVMDEGEHIPFPGKGTASYNCGEDALLSRSIPYVTKAEAIENLVNHVKHLRQIYPL